jgi:alkylated DNA repair dioxygenase AlkB
MEFLLNDTQKGASVEKYPGYLSGDESDELFRLLSATVLEHMTHDMIKMYGKVHESKRKVATISERPNVPYSYARTTRNSIQLTFGDLPWLDAIRRRMEQLCGHELNFVFLNFYRPYSPETPDDKLGFHSDSEPDMVPGSNIVSLSVGDTRHFAFRNKGETGILCQTPLQNGDVCIMKGTTQEHYEHAITARGAKQCTRGRFNLTFRQFVTTQGSGDEEEPASKRHRVDLE